ncbi:hypothetical protein GCM10009092_01340 [Bowmanella denitrificans]|uniref:Uncharacterized protein n=1 Tax=Bowmanella denitrificans TaxID=366582 RepID=A0ABN0WKJ9_9ALTE
MQGIRGIFSAPATGILVRIGSAAVLGYLATAECAVLIAALLPSAPLSSVLTAMLLSFPLFTALIMWSFHVPRAWRALTDLGGLYLAAALSNYLLLGALA